jgi:GT2 family glycosyltransferase
MPAAEASAAAFPDSFRIALAPGAVRPARDVVAVAPAGAAVRLSDVGATALDALASEATIRDACAAVGADVRPLARLLLDTGIAHPRPAGTRYAPADVTVVVPARNAAAPIEVVLRGVGPATAIVVDDGSGDGTGAVASRHGARVVRNERARGASAARNRGATRATTPLVAFIDADCDPKPGWFEGLLAHFDDPAVGAVAPRIVAARRDGSLLTRYEAARSVLDRGPHESRVASDAAVRLVPTAAVVVRRDALDDVGGLDESLHFGEDQDLVYRLSAAGWRIRYEPSVEVGHDHRTTIGAFVRRRAAYGTPAGRLARRHGRLEAAARIPSPALVPIRRELVDWGVPPASATDLVRRSALHTARSLGNTATRAWLLPMALAAARWRWLRAPLAAGVAARHAADWRTRRPPIALPSWIALRTLDETSLALGIWWGAALAHTTVPVRPVIASTVTGAADASSAERFVEAVRVLP